MGIRYLYSRLIKSLFGFLSKVISHVPVILRFCPYLKIKYYGAFAMFSHAYAVSSVFHYKAAAVRHPGKDCFYLIYLGIVADPYAQVNSPGLGSCKVDKSAV